MSKKIIFAKDEPKSLFDSIQKKPAEIGEKPIRTFISLTDSMAPQEKSVSPSNFMRPVHQGLERYKSIGPSFCLDKSHSNYSKLSILEFYRPNQAWHHLCIENKLIGQNSHDEFIGSKFTN